MWHQMTSELLDKYQFGAKHTEYYNRERSIPADRSVDYTRPAYSRYRYCLQG